jgi:hypothetical protein
MYKRNLFARGAKSFLTFRHRKAGAGSYGCSGAGSGANMDNYLLGLVSNIGINSKPKGKKKGSGGGLKFIR